MISVNQTMNSIYVFVSSVKYRQQVEKVLGASSFNEKVVYVENGQRNLIKEKDFTDSAVLVILDTGAANYHPYYLIKTIRTQRNTRHLPMMVITSLQDEKARFKALSMEVEEYLYSPISPRQVLLKTHLLIIRYRAICRGPAEMDMRAVCQGNCDWAGKEKERADDLQNQIDVLIDAQDAVLEMSRQELIKAHKDVKVTYEAKIKAIQEKSELQMAFGKYISPEVVDKILKQDSVKDISGDRFDVTVMFADIRGFTQLAENMKADKTVFLLNEYFTELTQIIITHTGLVDKYIGDCIMAIFGAPQRLTQHHHLALLAAIKMQDKFRQLRLEWKELFDVDIGMGIGINSGEALVGTIGSFQKMSYTAIGDMVNMASRPEDVSRDSEILFSDTVRERIKPSFLDRHNLVVEARGETTLKGKTGLYKIFNIGRPEGPVSPQSIL